MLTSTNLRRGAYVDDIVTEADMDYARPILPPRPTTSWKTARGIPDDTANWSVVYTLYEEDKLEAAQDVLNGMGHGMAGGRYLSLVRLVESEVRPRVLGTRISLASDLDLEYMPEEQGHSIESISQKILSVTQGERSRFGWQGRDKVLVTLLSIDNDAPWATGRFGYCTAKADYFKICVPYHATLDTTRFANVLAHEFAHVISMSESKGRISNWLGEGFSVYASQDLNEHSKLLFLHSSKAWLAPEALELQFRPSLDLGTKEKWLAYQQSGWLVRFLVRLKGEAELVRLFAEYADEGILRNLKLLALGESKTRDAIHHVYGLGLEEFFSKARNSLATL